MHGRPTAAPEKPLREVFCTRRNYLPTVLRLVVCPLVVLVNENSASAAEIFSGAVKDHGVGTLVGTTTFGKGIVQQTFSLGDGSAVKLTTSRYYTPNGVNIQGTGITPDVESDWPENAEEFTNPNQFNELSQEEWESKDAQMKKAREVLSEKVAQVEQ